MSLLRRPAGDEVAEHYGKYYDVNTLRFIKRGEKYEVLCSDGLNYIVEVKEIDPDTLRVHLHFPNWKNRFDFKGSLKDIYITEEGMYSKEAGITSNNTYDFEGNGMGISAKRDRMKRAISGAKSSYAANTKYDPDFFSKPRPSWAKKRRMSESDSSQQGDDVQGLANENISQEDTSSDDGSAINVKEESAMVFKRQRIEDIALMRASASPNKGENNVVTVLANKVPQHALLQHFMSAGSSSVGVEKSKHKLSRDATRNESKAPMPNNSSSKVGIVDLIRQTGNGQNSKPQNSIVQSHANTNSSQIGTSLKAPLATSVLEDSSEANIKPSKEVIRLNGALEIPDDVIMLVHALELSYTVDETQKVIDVINNKKSNINIENKNHVDLLLRLLQIRRNIDQSILSLIESNE